MVYQFVQRMSAMPFFVKNSLIVAALHLHTHNQILPRAVQIHGQDLIGCNGLRGHLTPAHQWESLTDVIFLLNRDYLIAIRPDSALDYHSAISSDSSLRVCPLSLSVRSYSSSSDHPLHCATI